MVVSPAQGGEAVLWRAVAELAEVWVGLPAVRQLVSQLPRNAADRSDGLPGYLQNLLSSSGAMGRRPMCLGSDVRRLLTVSGDVPFDLRNEFSQWMTCADQVESAHRVSIAWLRSRLPRYPRLLAPQLVRDSALTTDEFTNRLAWRKSDLAAGFQFQNPPEGPLSGMGATAPEVRRATAASKRLLRCLEETDQWVRFREADRRLSTGEAEQLSAARQTIATSLAPDKIDEFEPRLAVRRYEYRTQVVADALDRLSGGAREYAEAFSEIDRLIEFSCGDVFGHCVAYEPIHLHGVIDLAMHGGERQSIEFGIEGMPPLEPGSICILDDPLFPEIVFVTELTLDFNQASGFRQRATARPLEGAAAALRVER